MAAGRRATTDDCEEDWDDEGDDTALRWFMYLLGARTRYERPSFECFDEFEDLLHVARHLHAAPLAAHHALRVDGEGAAFDAAHLLAVHVLHLDDVVELARGFLRVGQEVER